MLFYDLDLGAWVRKPGSVQPPWFTPVLTIGSKWKLEISFCRGADIQNPGASGWLAGVKIQGDPTGEFVASDDAPYQNGSDGFVFTLDLTTEAAKSYFVTHADDPTVNCVIQIALTVGGDEQRTIPIPAVLQNDYLQTA